MKKIFMFSLLLLTAGTFKQAQALPTGYQPSIKDPIGLLTFAWNVAMWHSECTSSLNKKDKKVSENQTPQEEILSPQVEEEPFVEEKETQQLPPEVFFKFVSFIHKDSKKFALLDKDLHSKMFNKNGNPKSRFLRAAAGINSWKDSYSEKVEKLFLYLFNSEIVPTMNNINEIIFKKKLARPSDNFKITKKEDLVELALLCELSSVKALKAAITFLNPEENLSATKTKLLFKIIDLLPEEERDAYQDLFINQATNQAFMSAVKKNERSMILYMINNDENIRNILIQQDLDQAFIAATQNRN